MTNAIQGAHLQGAEQLDPHVLALRSGGRLHDPPSRPILPPASPRQSARTVGVCAVLPAGVWLDPIRLAGRAS